MDRQALGQLMNTLSCRYGIKSQETKSVNQQRASFNSNAYQKSEYPIDSLSDQLLRVKGENGKLRSTVEIQK